MINFYKKQKGFAMLFTVLLVSLILTIAISISNITLKQTILSSLAKDSQIAFYQADAGMECGLYQDNLGNYPKGSTKDIVPQSFLCGENSMSIDLSSSKDDYFVFYEDILNQNGQCFSVVFDKRDIAGDNLSIIQSRGYNRCSTNPRQVERALQVTY